MTVAITAAGARRRPLDWPAMIGVLGVVYGDIGTSPLYALQGQSRPPPTARLGDTEILGILSLIFWALLIVS